MSIENACFPLFIIFNISALGLFPLRHRLWKYKVSTGKRCLKRGDFVLHSGEFIALMRGKTKQAIVTELQWAKYFSVIVDLTLNVSHVDHSAGSLQLTWPTIWQIWVASLSQEEQPLQSQYSMHGAFPWMWLVSCWNSCEEESQFSDLLLPPTNGIKSSTMWTCDAWSPCFVLSFGSGQQQLETHDLCATFVIAGHLSYHFDGQKSRHLPKLWKVWHKSTYIQCMSTRRASVPFMSISA